MSDMIERVHEPQRGINMRSTIFCAMIAASAEAVALVLFIAMLLVWAAIGSGA